MCSWLDPDTHNEFDPVHFSRFIRRQTCTCQLHSLHTWLEMSNDLTPQDLRFILVTQHGSTNFWGTRVLIRSICNARWRRAPFLSAWYIPHHPVLNPKKPGKVRVVFDCAAKANNRSLNEELLRGPDLTNNLVGVLSRFREEPVAMMADIRGMFNQVMVAPEDRQYLGFLWWPEGELTAEPEAYTMNVHLFGATSSPSCAAFCLKRTAEDHKTSYSAETIDAVNRSSYVDDFLMSVPDSDKAARLITELPELLSKGGFHLAKWSSWKWWPVIMSPAHNPLLLQLPLLLHSMTLADYIGDKNWIQQVLVELSSSFPINCTCCHFTAVGKYCTLCVQMLDGANWHEAPWKLGLFTFWLWSGHCSQLALISTAMIQIYNSGVRLMSFKK